MNQTDRLLNEVEVSALVGRSVPSLRRDRLFERGVPFVRQGRQVRYRESAIARYMDTLPAFGGAPLPGKAA
ncbi:MAG: DNA-binding protein [Acidobacteria bacterium]|nr:DNA-binding protein [Acidobacteriota bacterium]